MKRLKNLAFILLTLSFDCLAQSEMSGKLTSVGGGRLAPPLFMGSLFLAIFLVLTVFKKASNTKKFVAFVSITFGPLFSILAVIILHNIIPNDQSREQERLKKIGIEAEARFKELCDTQEGEKTYEQLKGVKSFLIKQNPKIIIQKYEFIPARLEKSMRDINATDPYFINSPLPWAYSTGLAPYLIANSEAPPLYTCAFLKQQSIVNSCKDETMPILFKPSFEKIEEYLLEDDTWQVTERDALLPANAPILNKHKKSVNIKTYSPSSKYALEIENIESKFDRNTYAIAGVQYKIIEISSNKLIATKTIFMWDPFLGSNLETRLMWEEARGRNTVCPKYTWTGSSTIRHMNVGIWREESRYNIAKWLTQVLNP